MKKYIFIILVFCQLLVSCIDKTDKKENVKDIRITEISKSYDAEVLDSLAHKLILVPFNSWKIQIDHVGKKCVFKCKWPFTSVIYKDDVLIVHKWLNILIKLNAKFDVIEKLTPDNYIVFVMTNFNCYPEGYYGNKDVKYVIDGGVIEHIK